MRVESILPVYPTGLERAGRRSSRSQTTHPAVLAREGRDDVAGRSRAGARVSPRPTTTASSPDTVATPVPRPATVRVRSPPPIRAAETRLRNNPGSPVNTLGGVSNRTGAAQLVARLRREGLTNVRVAVLDAAEVLEKLLPAGSVSELWVFFPDPWHKKKHNKRRLVQEPFITKVARALPEGGIWRLATDWSGYAEQMRELLSASPHFSNPHAGQRAGEDSPLTEVRLHDLDAASLGRETHPLPLAQAMDRQGGWAPRFEGRVQTDFETKALAAGRRIFDMTFIRTAHNATAGYANDSWEDAAIGWSGREP